VPFPTFAFDFRLCCPTLWRIDSARVEGAPGDLFGLYSYGAEPMRLYAVPLVAGRGETNPLQRVEFFDADGRPTAGC
jgi:hypothetical protein